MTLPDDPTEDRPPEDRPPEDRRWWETDVVLADGGTVHLRPRRHEDADRFQAYLLEQTPTLGVRRSVVERRVLPRRRAEVQTKYGRVEGMVVAAGQHGSRFSPEYESCRRAAALHDAPLERVYDEAIAAYLAAAEIMGV